MGNIKRNQLVQTASQQPGPSPSPLGQLQHASTQEDVSPAVRCAENIVLLELLNPVPSHPPTQAASWLSQDRHGDVDRTLSMSQESELATNLAFLAGISDDPSHIMAVCIEELPKAEGCQVLVAINKRLPTDGVDILRKAQRGFQQIFGRLKEVSSVTRAAVEETVFNDIVALCHERILSRLRYKKSNASYFRSQKRFIGLVLQEFISSPWQDRVRKSSLHITDLHLTRYRRRLEDLSADLDDLEAADVVTHEGLSRLVRRIARFIHVVPLAGLLGVLSDQEMHRVSRDRLLNCLLKIARYHECARFLCRKACQFPMLRNIAVRQVRIAARTAGVSVPNLPTVDFEESLRRFYYRGDPVQIRTLPEWLVKAAVSSQLSFPNDVKRIRKEAKVHAEIQLLAHYDNVDDGVVPPRMLASSKDACYLCHSLIELHGKYVVPKSHGKLYKGWCLPAAYQGGPLQRSLNSFLERQISATLQSLMAVARRPLVMFSNESTIFPINLSASTLAGPASSLLSSAMRSGVAAPPPVSEDVVADSKADRTSEAVPIQNCHVESMGTDSVEDDFYIQSDMAIDAVFSEPGGEKLQGVWDGVDDKATDNDAGSDCTKGTTDRSSASNRRPLLKAARGSCQTLSPGQTSTYEPASRRWFRTNGIDLFIDDSSAKFSARLLSGSEAEAVLRADTNTLFDIESISPGMDVELARDDEGRTYFALGREVVMIRALGMPDGSP